MTTRASPSKTSSHSIWMWKKTGWKHLKAEEEPEVRAWGGGRRGGGRRGGGVRRHPDTLKQHSASQTLASAEVSLPTANLPVTTSMNTHISVGS